ncbi:MAG TPA: hypothetical protein EYP58_00315, partial [bacterium (Candidatus Stahlbacteria)]|nr:hypothetical protein [Candidatus Stahlbacteria bacterium]
MRCLIMLIGLFSIINSGDRSGGSQGNISHHYLGRRSQPRQWTPISHPIGTDERYSHATVYDPDDDLVFMIGGSAGLSGRRIPDCDGYDPTTDSWRVCAPMAEPVSWIDGAYWNGKIYIAGGYTSSGGASGMLKIYDIGSDSWSTGADLPIPTFAYVAVPLNGSIYIIGGYPASATSVQRYDVANNSWTNATSLPMAFDMGSGVIIDNVIYLVGGYNRGSGQVYTDLVVGVVSSTDPDTISWSLGDALPYANFLNGTGTCYGQIYMVGGFMNGSSATNQV